MGDTSPLDAEPGLIHELAVLMHEGRTRGQIATALGRHKDTISRWWKDPRVLHVLRKLREERIARITRVIDGKIEQKLDEMRGDVDLETLIKVRRELLPPAPQRHLISGGGDMTDAQVALYQTLQEHPELAEALGLTELVGAPEAPAQLAPGAPEPIVDAEVEEPGES